MPDDIPPPVAGPKLLQQLSSGLLTPAARAALNLSSCATHSVLFPSGAFLTNNSISPVLSDLLEGDGALVTGPVLFDLWDAIVVGTDGAQRVLLSSDKGKDFRSSILALIDADVQAVASQQGRGAVASCAERYLVVRFLRTNIINKMMFSRLVP